MPGPSVGNYLITSRSPAEYAAMFALTPGDLAGSVLDCPGGGAAFTADACARGAAAVSVDPVYADSPDALATRLRSELARGAAWTRDRAAAYTWDFHGGPQEHARMRAEAAARFVADLREHPDRYVAGALPDLPFADGSVDLVLSSHLLFTYADRLDEAFHVAALREMARVARREVRVYPVVDQTGAPLDHLVERLLLTLCEDGLDAQLRDVRYEFQRGARQCLVVAGRTGWRAP